VADKGNNAICPNRTKRLYASAEKIVWMGAVLGLERGRTVRNQGGHRGIGLANHRGGKKGREGGRGI